VLSQLEGKLHRKLRPVEYERFTTECAEKAKTPVDLEECANRLYDEFSKHPIQLPVTKPKPEKGGRPIEEGALVKGGEEEAPPTPRRVVSRKGLPIPVARRSGRPIQLMPEERPVVVFLPPSQDAIRCFWQDSYEEAKDFAAYMRSIGGTILCLGPLEACEEYAEYCGRRPVT